MTMNSKLKFLLIFAGAALLSTPALQAQRGGGGTRGGSFAAHPSFVGHSSLAGRSAFATRPAANAHTLSANAARGGLLRSGTRQARGAGYYGRGGYNRGGYRHYGRYYYLGGVPYFYPFYGYGYGFGYPGYYGGFYGNGLYGDGFYGGAGSEGAGYADRAYEGRLANRNGDTNRNSDANGNEGSNNSLPSAVQRQLAKRGYYKGSVDGQFGPASRDALTRFQKSQGIKQNGRIDEDTLDALGFTDQR